MRICGYVNIVSTMENQISKEKGEMYYLAFTLNPKPRVQGLEMQRGNGESNRK